MHGAQPGAAHSNVGLQVAEAQSPFTPHGSLSPHAGAHAGGVQVPTANACPSTKQPVGVRQQAFDPQSELRPHEAPSWQNGAQPGEAQNPAVHTPDAHSFIPPQAAPSGQSGAQAWQLATSPEP